MNLKRLKKQLGEPLSWSDYLSLPFTQTVSYFLTFIHKNKITANIINHKDIIFYTLLNIKLQVITETLRVGNIIIGVMRKAMKDVEIKGYLIPKGWCAFAYFRSVHLDENHYDWPYEFNPWRWQVSRTNFINLTVFTFL